MSRRWQLVIAILVLATAVLAALQTWGISPSS